MLKPSTPPAQVEQVRISDNTSATDLLAELKAAVDAGKAKDALILAGILIGSLEPQEPQDGLIS